MMEKGLESTIDVLKMTLELMQIEALIQACIAEMKGMEAENRQREFAGNVMAYRDADFFRVQSELTGLVQKLEEIAKSKGLKEVEKEEVAG